MRVRKQKMEAKRKHSDPKTKRWLDEWKPTDRPCACVETWPSQRPPCHYSVLSLGTIESSASLSCQGFVALWLLFLTFFIAHHLTLSPYPITFPIIFWSLSLSSCDALPIGQITKYLSIKAWISEMTLRAALQPKRVSWCLELQIYRI